jgi:hypothetical protein
MSSMLIAVPQQTIDEGPPDELVDPWIPTAVYSTASKVSRWSGARLPIDGIGHGIVP